MFNVQLKGTDNQDAGDGSAARIRVGTGEYSNRLHLPTLVVRFHSPTGHLYSRWWHEYPFMPAAGQREITVRFEAAHRWTDSTLLCGAPRRGYAYLDQLRDMTVQLDRPVRAELLELVDLVAAGRAFGDDKAER